MPQARGRVSGASPAFGSDGQLAQRPRHDVDVGTQPSEHLAAKHLPEHQNRKQEPPRGPARAPSVAPLFCRPLTTPPLRSSDYCAY